MYHTRTHEQIAEILVLIILAPVFCRACLFCGLARNPRNLCRSQLAVEARVRDMVFGAGGAVPVRVEKDMDVSVFHCNDDNQASNSDRNDINTDKNHKSTRNNNNNNRKQSSSPSSSSSTSSSS